MSNDEEYVPDMEIPEDMWKDQSEQQFGMGWKAEQEVNMISHDWDVIGEVGEGQQKFISQTPREAFEGEIRKIFYFNRNLNLVDKEKEVLWGSISKIHWIQFKVPILYVVGYMVYMDGITLQSVNKYINEVDDHTSFDILKYARYWENIVTKTG